MGQRPAHLTPPSYLSESPPLPLPADAQVADKPAGPTGEKEGRPEPTRYGDWERNGIAVDF